MTDLKHLGPNDRPDDPVPGTKPPAKPYPVDEPVDPHGPGSEPDYMPGKQDNPMPRF